MLFSLRVAVLLHKSGFKNIEVEVLKVSEKSWDFLILTVIASTVLWRSGLGLLISGFS